MFARLFNRWDSKILLAVAVTNGVLAVGDLVNLDGWQRVLLVALNVTSGTNCLVVRRRIKRRAASVRRCALCDERAYTTLNGVDYCGDHINDGFRMTARGQAIEHGIDPDEAEWRLWEMLSELFPPREDPPT